ncbi:MAG: hypothetical protein EON59_09030 [Alphaproteobacteria bacterium]|nr:MAG: hypothetical protein EON59_09030 [Alphaproteobacteria bacterium]
MPIGPRIAQGLDEVVSLDGWEPDEDFPFGPLGAKAKRIFICPTPAPYGFLIGGHRYIFKEPEGSKAQQVWSEVIAYEIAKLVHVEVPPAFLATGPGNGSPGVLIEYFYGHVGDPDRRLVHGIERLQARGFQTDLRRGSLSGSHKVPHAGAWWAQTLAFDSLIGNTDRHSENWGFLVEPSPDGGRHLSMAPAFDNGTSLGFIVGDRQLADFTKPERLGQFIANGHHHFGWTSGDKGSGQHVALCRWFARQYPSTQALMRDTVNIADSEVDAVVVRCVGTRFPTVFSEQRAQFVAAQLKARREELLNALGA